MIDLTTSDIKSYERQRIRAGAQPATINRELAALKRAFNLAFKHDPPKVERVPYIPMLKENNVRTGFLTWDQYSQLKAELPPYLRMFLVLAYHIGSRSGELKRLRWEQVDLDAWEITLYAGETKNDDGRVLPIYDEEMRSELIEAKRERTRCVPVSSS